MLCNVLILSGVFLVKGEVKGTLITQTQTKYYLDFSKDLVANGWKLWEGRDGKKIVPKTDCIEIK
jgi:hypothetical protein